MSRVAAALIPTKITCLLDSPPSPSEDEKNATIPLSLRLRYCTPAFDSDQTHDVSHTQTFAQAQYLRLRIRADGESHRLSRVRRALAVRQRSQSDGHRGARTRPRHAYSRVGRRAAHRDRARFPLLFGLDQNGAGERADRRRLQGVRHRPRGYSDGLFRAVRSRRAVRRHGHRFA